MKQVFHLFLLCTLISCGTVRKPYYADFSKNWLAETAAEQKETVHTLYLIGDVGDKKDVGSNYVLQPLQKMLDRESEASSLVFLGNQIYHHGMPTRKSEDRKQAESILNEQLDIVKEYKGNTYFIPGQKDWNNGMAKGLKALKRQQKYIETYFGPDGKVQMVPGDGCADPKVVKINKDLVFVFVDSQWWLQDWIDEKNINRGCDIKSRNDFLERIEEIFTDHKNDEIVILMHHPIKSNGVHNGHLSAKHHLFPFKESHNISVPLPIIGTFVALHRNIKGTKQDLNNDNYWEMVEGIEGIALELRVNALFASAHDNGLQHFDKQKLQYVVSGSGSRTNRTVKGGEANFTQQERGFGKVIFYEEQEIWLEFYSITGPNEPAELVYKVQLREPRPGSVEEEVEYPPLSLPDTTIAASKEFLSGPVKEVFMGKQYREMWGTPVKVPMIDLEKEYGGLTPIKKGGGMSSNSLRMETGSGRQYILRSIKKDYRKLVPPEFADLKILDVLKDQNSASHPYGALVLPPLSRAAGIYYTDPSLVYLKHQRGLGNYNSQFPEELYLLEQRPDGDWSDASQFGNSSEIIGYTDLVTTLREKKNHFIDQEWVLKSRMFDLLIHDWDRHDDQWRWASFEEGGKTIYRLIPRDRDQAFYKFKGLIPSYIAAFAIRKFKTMKDDVKDVANLSFNARYFDRYFMHELEWSEWQPIINELQKNITDEIIDEAMLEFPEEVRSMSDADLAGKLKSRRDKLESIGKKLYDFLSEEVEIPATDNNDRFYVTIEDNGNVQVQMFVERKEKGDLLKYDRTFYPGETKEIRMYGLRGKDEFVISGSGKTKITIRVIGGEDKDKIENKTQGVKIAVYDETGGIGIMGLGIKDYTSNSVGVNDYDRTGFKYNTGTFFPTFGWTPDDGFWIGAMTANTNHGWRKTPYRLNQAFSFSVAPGGQDAFKVKYTGRYPKILGALDFTPDIQIDFPRNENFFGLGNESVNDAEERAFNWVRIGSIEITPLWTISSKDNSTSFSFGPAYESQDIKKTENRVSVDEILGFTEEEFGRRHFLGGQLAFESGFVDNPVFPAYGFQLGASLGYLNTLSIDEEVLEFSTAVHTYIGSAEKVKIRH